jgi:putative CocE/NonD family hydrolase
VIVERDVPARMRDGVALRADVWRPAADGRYPVLLQRLPYSKGDPQVAVLGAGLDPLRAVEAGFVVVIQDTRGRYASEGEFVPFVDEAQDGADTVAWCAALPYANGRVGMYGQSYFGATQLLAATATPAGLGAIAPAATGCDYYDGWTYQGGVFQLGFVLHWLLSALAEAELERRPPDARRRLREAYERLANDPWAAFSRLPLTDLDGLEDAAPYYRHWLEHDRRDEFWRSISPRERYGAIVTPALHIGGWYDLFVSGTIENFVRLQEEAGTEEARRAQRLVVGPWAHACLGDTVGEREFGPAAALSALDPTALHLRFFDEHLRDGPPGDEAPVRVFLMGANRWLDEETWPVRGVDDVRWHLRDEQRLTLEPPALDERPDEFVYDPRDPVPTLGGATFLPGLLVARHAGARDTAATAARSDVLVYDSEPLEQSLDVIGSVSATLAVASSAPDTDFTAKLVDVEPDGGAILVCDGIVSLRGAGDGAPQARSGIGVTTSLTIELGPTAVRLAAGHRIRVEVSSSNFPRFARSPNSEVPRWLATTEDLAVARQRVFHDSLRPSHITLPTRGRPR